MTPWGLVFILFGAGILAACQVGKVPPLLPDIRMDLNISLFYAGWILSIFNFTGLLLGTFTGIIADTIGHRKLMIAGFFLLASGSAAGSFAQSLGILLCARFLEGAGFLSVIISTPALIFRIVQSRDLKVALSVWSCYLPAGVALMMLAIPAVLTVTDWQGLWRLSAVILALYALILARATAGLKDSKKTKIKIAPVKMVKDIIRTTTHPGSFLLAAIFVAYSLQWLAVMGFLPTLMVEKFGFSKSAAALLTAGMVGINIFGNLAGGRLLKYGIRRWKLIAFASLIQGCCAFAIYSNSPIFVVNYAGCLIFSLVGGLIPASVLGGVPLYAPSKQLIGTANGLAIQGGQSGQVIGPPILALLVSHFGSWAVGSWFLSGVALCAIIFSLFLARQHPAEL